MPLPRLRSASLVLAAAALAACAARKQSWRETSPAEVFVDVLPRNAQLAVDGRALGPGARTLPVPDPEHVYALQASAPGFQTAERSALGSRLSGAYLGIVLRPDGFGSARRLDLDDAAGLAQAAALLERGGRHREAIEYAERAVELAPDAPAPRRVLGTAFLAVGNRQRAIQELSAYCQLAPDAPDRAAVQKQVSTMRGDVTIPGLER